MEIKRYFVLVRRWAWLLILGVVLGAAGGFLGSYYQTPVYRASTRFVIMRAAQTNYDYYAYLDSQQLVQTYIQLLTTDRVLVAAASELGIDAVSGVVSAQQVGDSQFVLLSVEDTDPQRAADTANVLVTVLINQNEEIQSVRYISSEKNLQSQVDQVQSQITSLQTQINEISAATVQDQLVQIQTQIDALQTQITELNTRIAELKRKYQTAEVKAEMADKEATLAQLEPVLSLYQQVYTNLVVLGQPVENGATTSTRLDQLQNTLNLYQNIYLNLLDSLEAVRLSKAQNTPSVVQVEPANPNFYPVRPQPVSTSLLAGAVGLLLAMGIAFLVEYLDDTLKTSEDVERILNLPVIGYIAQIHYDKGNAEKLYVIRQPRSPISEAFRSLRTNLEFAGVDRPIRRVLVTSAGPSEGKTTVSVNLAAIIAQGGKRVSLLDADLRRPMIHRFLDLPNQFGLSDLFRGTVATRMVSQRIPSQEQVSVITSGSLPPNPTELLASARMEQILQDVGKDADIIVVDSPPTLVADVQVLAAKVDAVILVVHPGHTEEAAARATLEMLNRSGAHTIGVVMNRIPRDRADYYGGYRHYSPYYSSHHYYSAGERDETKGSARIKRMFRGISPFKGNGRKKTEEHVEQEIPGEK
jgi:capsular exopolysaccharide synthesis family protein